MYIYNARMRLLPFSWFSMKLSVINSFLVVCFTIVQKFGLENTEFPQKYHLMAIKQYLKKCITFTINTRERMFQ